MPRQMTNEEFATIQMSDQWHTTVTDASEALPVALAEVTDAYGVGWADAEIGLPCEPTTHYIKTGDVENYIVGWNDCTKAMDDAAEYADFFADEVFVRTGC